MQQNPSQGIRKYALGDVYTPGDSNSRRERMVFDFVVTEAQFRAYKAKSSGSPIDLGDLIWCLPDGSPGLAPAEADRPAHPIHIYIDAFTTEADAFQFGSSRFAVDGLQASLLEEWARGSDKAYVHVYSRAPYSVASIGGGFALHSTAESCVTLPTTPAIGRSGVFRVGMCKAQDGGVVNTYARPGYPDVGGLTIIYEKCIAGEITWKEPEPSTRPADSVTPGAVCAPWMSSSVDCEIKLTYGATRQYAAFARIAQAVQNESVPSIRAIRDEGFVLLKLAAATGSSFTFEGGGQRLEVTSTDNLLWEDASGSGSSQAVIRDYNISRNEKADPSVGGTADLAFMASVLYYIGDDVKTFRGGGGRFLTLREDTGASVDWYDGATVYPFDFKGATQLDWYTWCAFSAMFTNPFGFGWVCNPNNLLPINTESLREGIVYEVNLHIMRLPANEYEINTPSGHRYAGVQIAPNSTAASPEGSPARSFGLSFCDKSGVPVALKYWGTESSAVGSIGRCTFACTKHTVAEEGFVPAAPAYTLAELASGTVQFVKLGGAVYILQY